MTSKELEKIPLYYEFQNKLKDMPINLAVVQVSGWQTEMLREIAYQLAVMNEHNAAEKANHAEKVPSNP